MSAKYALSIDLWPVDDLTATKPVMADLVNWLGLQATPDDETLAKYTRAIATAVEDIEGRVVLPYGTTDEAYPQRLATAELIIATRLAKRATSPEGVAGCDRAKEA